jgi:hypothetical protein
MVLPGTTLVPQPTFRLTNNEYANTVRDLLGSAATQVTLDPDGAAAGFSAGLVVGDEAVRAYHTAAISLASRAASATYVTALLQANGCANAATPDDACAATFISTWVPKAFRRPVDPTVNTALVNLYTAVKGQFGFAGGLQAVIEEVLQSPNFLYHLELEEQAQGAGKVAVTGYSMASRLSYLLWSSMPDATLVAHAAAGQLSTVQQIQAEVTRMVADPKARPGLRNFYEQWFRLAELPTTKTGTYGTMYTQAVQDSIRASFDAQMDAALWADTGSVNALINGKTVYADANIASLLYGVTGVTSTTPQAIPVTNRAGIMSHPAVMATFATDNGTHPILRGVFLWDALLCEPLPDPPAGVPVFPGVQPGSSVRKQYETFTSPALCQACHSRINPVGFLFENYNTLGAYTTTDDTGSPVDLTNLTISGTGDSTIDGASVSETDLMNKLAASPSLATGCFVKHLYRYLTKRDELSADAATLQSLTTGFTSSNQSVKQLLGALTQTEAFLYRANVN